MCRRTTRVFADCGHEVGYELIHCDGLCGDKDGYMTSARECRWDKFTEEKEELSNPENEEDTICDQCHQLNERPAKLGPGQAMWLPAAKILRETPGFTLNHKNGRIMKLEGHYLVGGGIPDNNSINSHPGYSKMALGTVTKLIADFAKKYRTELGKKDCYLGSWVWDDTLFLDDSNTEKDRKRAHLLSLYRKELAIYFFDSEGGRELDNKPIEEIFETSFKYRVALEESERANQSFVQLEEAIRKKNEELDQVLKELNKLKKRKRPTRRSWEPRMRRRSIGVLFSPGDSLSPPGRIHKESSQKDGTKTKASSPDAGPPGRKRSK